MQAKSQIRGFGFFGVGLSLIDRNARAAVAGYRVD
jgi:hypothetical protein